MPPELLGPYALTAAALIAIGVLWRDHQTTIRDLRVARDRAIEIAAAQVAATNRVAEGQEELALAFREYLREQSTRSRRGDA